ncbi:DNA mismatch repair protein MutS [Altererythrobacter indicus]|uniref:DNA mismatch repair protein MutS n=1 Tax=Altericroceibacterium indicum TaxID=374177 RepID=A0A845AAW5_9SPHN|nr:Smr/MutS family protein [Altericroceibacterium indicum]MXP26647.1 DNA mismatch repair protein MutS [Altericroceibacterium indicum]
MKPPRGLSEEEAALWARVTASVEPMHRAAPPKGKAVAMPKATSPTRPVKSQTAPASRPIWPPAPGQDFQPRKSSTPAVKVVSPPPPKFGEGLDSTWEKKLSRTGVAPDFTLDLHGHTLDAAHQRLEWGLAQAKAMGARVVLVVTGKPRNAEAADRADRRGAIRAKILDWLASGTHASDIAAIRNAHRRHGGSGALYVILRRRR